MYTTTGTLPTQPLYAVPTSKSVQRREMAEAGHKKTRAPRKPTPFNFFIKVRWMTQLEWQPQLVANRSTRSCA